MKKLLTGALLLVLTIVLCTGCSADKGTNDYNKGIVAMKSGNYEEACKLLGTAISKNTEEPLYYINYATTLVQLKRYGEAVSSYQKAITSGEDENKENNKRAYRGLGIAYYYQKKYDDAQKNLEKAINIGELPELNLDAYLYLGAVQEIKGDMKGAYTTYGSALSLDDTKISAYVGRYKSEIALGKYEQADDTLDKGLNQTPSTTEDKYMYARLQFYTGEYEEATATLEEVKDTYPESYMYLGEIYSQNKKYDQAIETFQTYIEKSGADESIQLCTYISDCYIKLEKYKKAMTWIEKGIAMKGTDTELENLRFSQVIVYEQLDELQKAYDCVEEYATLYTKDDRFLNKLKELEKNPAITAKVTR